jgi:hypothetical protein
MTSGLYGGRTGSAPGVLPRCNVPPSANQQESPQTRNTRRYQDAWANDDLAMIPAHLHPDNDETFDLILRRKVFLVRAIPPLS